MKNSRTWTLALILCAGAAAYGLLTIFANQERKDSPKSTSSKSLSRARRWLVAVQQGEARTAVRLAEQLVGELSAEVPAAYIKLADREGISQEWFTDSFSGYDYLRWRSAVFFQEKARSLTAEKEKPLRALFRAVEMRLKNEEGPDGKLMWPLNVWKAETGLCDRQAWVFAELAYQMGWETQIVYLRDPETGVSPHTVVEVRKAPDRVALVDPYVGFLASGKGMERVAGEDDLVRNLWSDRPAIQRAAQDCVFWTPAYPQDYTPRNQKLQRVLRGVLGERCPRFGVDPAARMRRYEELRTSGTAKPRFPIRLWFWPFRLLNAEITSRTNTP